MEYTTFISEDDFVNKNKISNLLNKIEKNKNIYENILKEVFMKILDIFFSSDDLNFPLFFTLALEDMKNPNQKLKYCDDKNIYSINKKLFPPGIYCILIIERIITGILKKINDQTNFLTCEIKHYEENKVNFYRVKINCKNSYETYS